MRPNEAISLGLKGSKAIPKGLRVQSGASARLSEPLNSNVHAPRTKFWFEGSEVDHTL